jgi:hypothetical protein
VPQRPDLGDELVARTERELAAADALFARTAEDPALEAELERRMAGEVTPLIAALQAWDERPAEGTALLEINAENVEWLSARVEELGAWPGLRLVGADATDAAWLLAQHADGANELRRGWLPLIAAAVASGDADPRHFSSLTDRTAAVAGQP